jgi:NitT/TauT family transport system ATP-binding protein
VDPQPGIRIIGLEVTFPARSGRPPLTALSGLDLACDAGSVTAVIGPNGCGKSTLLRVLAGLLVPSAGEVAVLGGPPRAGDPRVGLVFQRPRLLPWRSVVDNVGLPLSLNDIALTDARAQAMVALEQVGLADVAHLRPGELSGGMQQRAGLARALVRDPELLLLDEPFSSLDSLTRDAFDLELARLVADPRRTVILVTHSVTEAVEVADRVVVLTARPGRIAADIAVANPRSGLPDSATEQRVRAALAALNVPDLRPWTANVA